jgi:hypothetical protein
VIRAERRLTRRSANFWALVYRIPPEEVAALKQSAGAEAIDSGWSGLYKLGGITCPEKSNSKLV